MGKLKVITSFGTRPEIIRLSRVLSKLDAYCNHVTVHTGQNYDYELNQIFFDDLGIRKPDHFLEAAGDSALETIGNCLIKADKVLDQESPDALLILGDTNSSLVALAAKRKKIPVFHMEAGNRCFDQRVPEEINRKIVDHLADINLTYSTIAREYLINEGIPADQVIKTGSPMAEVLDFYKDKIDKSGVLKKLSLKTEGYYLVSCHREENVDATDNFSEFANVLNNLAEEYNLPVIVSTHPRTRKKIEEGGFSFSDSIQFLKPLGFTDYVHLQIHAKTVFSDSGTITEESSILNFPALNIREAHERPEGMEEGAVILTGMNWERIRQALAILEDQGRGLSRLLNIVKDYEDTNVSDKVVRIIHSYTDYVNRKVWQKT
jgi:UDP-N-acetylglucosamine 2-epimerase (non-hydrolysing)